jgi:two-component system phosphate regulon sensor histidine kinase PhoR
MVTATLLVVAWVAMRFVSDGLWPVMGVLAVANLVTTVFLAIAARNQAAAIRFAELLGRAESKELRNSDPKAVTGLKDSNAWLSAFERVRGRLVDLGERLEQIEISQAALEVRSRRKMQDHDRITGILDSLSDPILAIDEYDEIVLANPRAGKLFDFEFRRDEKQILNDLVKCQNLVRLLTETRKRKSDVKRACELEIDTADGDSHSYRATARVLAGHNTDDRKRQGAVAILRDVTNHKQIQKRHAEFVSAVSHEMKTPLAGIKAYVELLADGEAEDDDTLHEFLGVINSQADRLQRLVENLLNIARIEAGVVKVSKQEQSLNELLERVYELMRPKAEEKSIELKSDLSPMYLGVYVDVDMILQAAINLLSNAIKYTPDGNNVTLRSRLVENAVEIEVEDTGVGLNEEDQEKVFEKFYRVGKDKSMASGTGLGLPLAKHIVEDVHQGTLRLTSELDAGSTFTIRLPSAGTINRPEPVTSQEPVTSAAE